MSNMKRMAYSDPRMEAFDHKFYADGQTYDPNQDKVRLGKQAQAVWDFMAGSGVWCYLKGERWHSLAEISAYTGHPEGSISARLRDFRKERFGSHTVERRRRKDMMGTWEYRLVVNPDA